MLVGHVCEASVLEELQKTFKYCVH